MSLLTSLFAHVTFFQVAIALVAVGMIERLLYLLPEKVVGNGGWLLDTGSHN